MPNAETGEAVMCAKVMSDVEVPTRVVAYRLLGDCLRVAGKIDAGTFRGGCSGDGKY
jgi:hypothetical protein